MPQFEYQVRTINGKQLKGTLTAADKTTAMDELRRRGLTVFSLNEQRKTLMTTEIYIGNPVKTIDFIVYCRQFATLIRAGVTILDATRILAEQTESKVLRKTLHEVHSKLMRGVALSQAVQESPKIFPRLFISMIRAGEESGDLEGTLERLAVYFEKRHVTREKIKSALTYPITVGILAIAVTVYLLVAIIPQFVDMFESMDAKLPTITVVILALSKSIQQQWYFWVLGLVIIIAAFVILKRSERGAYWIDYAKLKIPVFGRLNQKGSIAQFARTLSSLYASSVPVLQALSIVTEVAGNKVIERYLNQASESLRRGNALSDPLKKSWVFPPMVTQMIAIGEETGSLDQMLGKVADFYEMDVENTVDRLKSLLEPLLIAFLAAVVGIIVAAIMLPMFTLYDSVG
ncbi:type II secretion system F family protein [Paenibacillus wulumuqiensis]|uniref:type II secretion system F family protein n=1 Tax=Paenibacillus wulumuqiensis TaxID=1567107 RepID=UPI0006193DD2|nr:type II secretion system F family protein [Paenibacillus wulumuqiensis]